MTIRHDIQTFPKVGCEEILFFRKGVGQTLKVGECLELNGIIIIASNDKIMENATLKIFLGSTEVYTLKINENIVYQTLNKIAVEHNRNFCVKMFFNGTGTSEKDEKIVIELTTKWMKTE